MTYINRWIFGLILSVLCSPLVFANEPIKIGVSLSLTGKYSVMGISQMRGFMLWERDINAKGGLLGRRVKVKVYDDKSDPDIARQLYEKIITEDKVDFLFGPYSSPITEAVLPITERNNFPVLITGASGDKLWEQGYKNAIGVFLPASKFCTGIFELIVISGLDNIALIHADDLFSNTIRQQAYLLANRYGIKITYSESFKKGTRDLSPFALKARDSGAEVIILGGHFEDAVDMRLALKKIDWMPKAYFATVGAALDEYGKRLKGDAEYTFSVSLWEAKTNFPGAKRFYDDYLKTYGEPPTYHAAIAYSGGQILETAIKKAGHIDRDRLRDQLFKMDTITVLGRYGVDSTGRQVRQQSFIIQWQKGKREIVWPERIATARPVFK